MRVQCDNRLKIGPIRTVWTLEIRLSAHQWAVPKGDHYGSMTVAFGGSLSGRLSVIAASFMVLIIAFLGYPFLSRASNTCLSSLSLFNTEEQSELAREKRVLTTANLCASGWCELKCRYLFVRVLFLYRVEHIAICKRHQHE